MNFPKAKYPTRYVFAQRMTERGATDSEFVVFESDLAKSTYSYLFREKYPERYFDMGIAEIGTVASGTQRDRLWLRRLHHHARGRSDPLLYLLSASQRQIPLQSWRIDRSH